MLLTSCDQDIVNEIYLPGGGGSVVVTDSTSTKQLQVFTNLEMLQPAVSTRAVDNQWELNDMIGISSTGMINNMMSDDERLRVSRPRKKAFLAALADYMGGGR